MQTVTITRIFTKEEISPRTQKPYTRMSIKANEYGDKWISGFQNAGNKHWKEGDQVEIIITKKQSGDKEFLNFEVPKPEDKAKVELDKIHNLLTRMNINIERLVEHTIPKSAPKEAYVPLAEGVDYPDEDINPDDIPF